MQDEISQRNRDEQQQRRLDYGGEDAGPPDEQYSGDASQGVTGCKCAAQFAVVGTGFDRETGEGCGYRDQHSTPRLQTRTVPERGALIVRDRPLSWHS